MEARGGEDALRSKFYSLNKNRVWLSLLRNLASLYQGKLVISLYLLRNTQANEYIEKPELFSSSMYMVFVENPVRLDSVRSMARVHIY